MAVAPEDLLAPTGALTGELLTRLVPSAADAVDAAATYLTVGEAKADARAWTDPARRDRAALAWATYQALTHRAQQILAAPTSASAEGEGSRSYAVSQAQELRKEALEHLTLYEAEVAADAAVPVTEPTSLYTSRSSQATVVW